MPVITADELALLRTFNPGAREETFASFLKPLTLWVAQVNSGSLSRGDMAIPFNTGSGSHWSAVENYQEVWIGTSAGANDVARLRIRSVSSGDAGATGTLNVPKNNVIWADDMHLTFIHNYLFDAMYALVNVSEVFFKDRDIAYTDENTKPPPVANLKIWPRAQRLINGAATFWLDASDSYAIADSKTITTYALSCYPMTDTTVTFNTSTGIGRVDITGSTPDYRWLKLTVTDSNSKTQDTWRCIFVHGETPEDTGYPHIDFEVGSLNGSWEGGGWELGFDAFANASLADIPDMSFATVWQERTVDQYPNNTVRVNNYLFINPKITYQVAPASPCTVTATFHAGVMKDGVPSNGDTISVDIMASGTGWTNNSDTTASGEVTITGYVITGADCNGTLTARENGTSTTLVSKSYIQGQIITESSYYPADFIVFPQELIVGYTRTEKLDFDNHLGTGQDKLKITTVEGLLKNGFMFSVELDSRPTVTAWHEYENWLTIGRACHHIWRWHSTLMQLSNVYGLVDNTDIRAHAIFENGSLYSMPDTMARHHGIRAHVVCNKKGDLWLTQDTQLLLDSDRAALDTVAVITADDRNNELGLTREPEPDTALVFGSGLKFLGTYSTDTDPESKTYDELIPDVEIYCAIAPGTQPARRGEAVINIEKQVLTSQDQLNQLVGRVIGQANNIYPDMQAVFHSGYLYFLDIHLAEFWEIDIATGDTIKELAIPDLNLIARDITVKVETDKGTGQVEVNFEPEAEADIGALSHCPDTPSDLGGSIPSVPTASTGSGAIVTASSVDYLPPGSSAWTERTSEATECLIADPYWRTKAVSEASADAILIRGGVGYLKYSDDAGATWSSVLPSTDPPNTAGDSPAPTKSTVTYSLISPSHRWEDEFVVSANWQESGGEWRSWLYYTDDDWSTGTWLSLGASFSPCGDGDTPVEITGTTSFDAANWYSGALQRQMCLVDTDKLVIIYTENTTFDIYVQAVDVSSGTPVYGTRVLTGLTDVEHYSSTICTVDTNKFAIADNYLGGPKLQIGSVSGTTISLGTAGLYVTTRESSEQIGSQGLGSYSAYMPTLSAPGSTLLHIGRAGTTIADLSGANCESDSSTRGWHIAKVTISGTTFTLDTTTCLGENAVNWKTPLSGLSSGGSPWISDQCRLSSTKSLFAYTDNGTNLGEIVCIDDTTLGTPVGFGVGGVGNIGLVRLSTTKAILFYVDGSSTYDVQARVVTVAGTTITLGTPTELDSHVSGVSYTQTMEISGTEAGLWWDDNNSNCFSVAKVTANITANTIALDYICEHVSDSTVTAYAWAHDIDADTFLVMKGEQNHPVHGLLDPSTSTFNYTDVETCDYLGPLRTLGLAVGKYDGDTAWITGDDNSALYLIEVDLTTVTVTTRTILASATHAEVDSRLYYAIPATFWGSDTSVAIGGRFINPTTANLVHISYTANGTTFSDLVWDWDYDYCGAIITHPGSGLLAIRNTVSGRSKLYTGNSSSMILRSTTNLLAGVNPRGMDISFSGYSVLVSANVGRAIMVSVSPSPFQVWYDITSDHPTANGVNSLVIL